MTKAVTQTEGQEAAAIEVTAANGKRIKIKRPPVLAQYRLVEALGDAAESRVYLRMCIPLLWVAAIDDVAVHAPTTKMQVEGLIARLDEAGIAAVTEGIEKHFADNDSTAAAKK